MQVILILLQKSSFFKQFLWKAPGVLKGSNCSPEVMSDMPTEMAALVGIIPQCQEQEGLFQVAWQRCAVEQFGRYPSRHPAPEPETRFRIFNLCTPQKSSSSLYSIININVKLLSSC